MAETLVKERLAACVQIAKSIESTHLWKERIERSEEYLCLIKSSSNNYPEIEKIIKKIYPFDTPEIIETPITNDNKDYLE